GPAPQGLKGDQTARPDLLGLVHHPHAALADDARDAVLAGEDGDVTLRPGVAEPARGLVAGDLAGEQVLALLLAQGRGRDVRPQHRFDLGADPLIAGALLPEEAGALGGLQGAGPP